MSILPLLLTAGSGILNLVSNATNASQQKDRINKFIQTLETSKYKTEDKYNKLADLNRAFNTEATDVLNSTLIDYSLGDTKNTSNLRSKLAAKLLGEKAKLSNDLAMKIDDFNKQIDLQKAQAELGMPSYNLGNALTDLGMGAISGYQLSQTINLLNKYGENNTKKDDTNNKINNNWFNNYFPNSSLNMWEMLYPIPEIKLGFKK